MERQGESTAYACGDQIAGKYQLLRQIGAGGMGVVWVAHNLVLDVHVAVKLIRGTIAGPGAGQRLMREARSAARIAHPGVVRIYDFGTTERGDPYVVMEMLEGETLRDLLEREGRIEPRRAVALLLPIADALATLADSGIVHRDMKPENIILARLANDRVQPKLLDFGVAILPGTERFTWAGVVVGSPDYVAPEQAAGEDVDHRIDIWAFCIVLFEILTGRRPFTGDSIGQLLDAILDKPTPSMATLRVHDQDLEAIVDRGLRKWRDERWSSMREVIAALSDWAVMHGVTEDVTGGAIKNRATDAGRSPLSQAAPSSRGSGDAKTEMSPGRRRRRDAPASSRPIVVPDPALAETRDTPAPPLATTRDTPAPPPLVGRNTPAPPLAETRDPPPPPSSALKPTRILPGLAAHKRDIESGQEVAAPAPSAPGFWTRPRIALGLLSAALLLAAFMGVRAISTPLAGVPTAPTALAGSAPSSTAPAGAAPSDSAPAVPASGLPSATAATSSAPPSTASPGTTSPRPTQSAVATTAKTQKTAPAIAPSATSSRLDDLKDPFKKKP